MPVVSTALWKFIKCFSSLSGIAVMYSFEKVTSVSHFAWNPVTRNVIYLISSLSSGTSA